MKSSPNDPCPCGSGKKFKRCCGAPTRADHSLISVATDCSPQRSARTPRGVVGSATTITWNPISPSGLRRNLTQQSCIDLVQRTNPAVVPLFLELCDHRSTEAARALLDLLEPATEFEYERAWCLTDMRRMALYVLDVEPFSDPIVYGHLIRHGDGARWTQVGRSVQDILISLRPKGANVLDDIRDVCRRLDSPVPKLILGYELIYREGRLCKEAFELFSEAIRPSAWKGDPQYVPRWTQTMAHAVTCVIDTHMLAGRQREAIEAGQGVLTFPWEKGDISERSMSDVCGVFLALGLDTGLTGLCRRLLAAHPSWYMPHHWLGCIYMAAGKQESARNHFRLSVKTDQVDDESRMGAASGWLRLGAADMAVELLSTVKARDKTWEDLHARALTLLGRDDEALAAWERLAAQEPDNLDYLLQVAQLHDIAGRLDEAEKHYRACLEDESARASVQARVLLGSLFVRAQRAEESLEIFGWFQDPSRVAELPTEGFRGRLCESYGTALLATGRHELAVAYLQEAAARRPTWQSVYLLVTALLPLERWQDADDVLSGSGLLNTSPQLAYLHTIVLFRLQRWGEVLEALPNAEEWMRANNAGDQVHNLRLRALLLTGRPLDALRECEKHLKEVLANPELAELRAFAFERVTARIEALEQLTKDRDQALQAEQQWARRELSEVKGKNLRLVSEVRRLEEDRSQSRLASNTDDGRQRERLPEPVRTELPSDVVAVLSTAEATWQHLDEEADFGPVLVQLARALESVLVRAVCRPVLSFAQGRGVPVRASQAGKLGLGEAAILLAGELPLSLSSAEGSAWRESVELFWTTGSRAKDRAWLQRTAPSVVQGIAKQRNEAAHGATPASRSAALKMRKVLLGEGDGVGLLLRIWRAKE